MKKLLIIPFILLVISCIKDDESVILTPNKDTTEVIVEKEQIELKGDFTKVREYKHTEKDGMIYDISADCLDKIRIEDNGEVYNWWSCDTYHLYPANMKFEDSVLNVYGNIDTLGTKGATSSYTYYFVADTLIINMTLPENKTLGHTLLHYYVK